MFFRLSLNCEMSAPDTNDWSPPPRRMTTRMASSLARSLTYSGMSSHISWLTALRFSGWLNTIQPIAPSFSSRSLSLIASPRTPDCPSGPRGFGAGGGKVLDVVLGRVDVVLPHLTGQLVEH